ncbi:MAG: Crp/Fnr family transcriptional regulator [Anaerolineales bacterium]|nr:MAG: Crp/Fnr family transcriptional regulator [Anaerolineales bacterium]
MISPEQFNHLAKVLPVLKNAGPDLLREIQQKAFYAHIPAGRDVFLEDDRADAIALLISGVVRVYKIGETGREITLYRFGNGESCILTANAILSQKNFPAIATVEKDAEAVMIPAETFRDWVRRYDLWREFVFDLLSERLSSVMEIVEEVAFHRMDARVVAFLSERMDQSDSIQITHQEIAGELGSSREVISRILEDFSALGMISVSRGTIKVLDRKALQARSIM